MEIILNQEALAKVLDDITLEKLVEAEKIKSEYEAKKLEIELQEKKQKIKEVIKDCWAFNSYFNGFATDSDYEEKTPYIYVCEYRDRAEVYETYIDLAREYGFELVDEVIQERIDLELSYLKEED